MPVPEDLREEIVLSPDPRLKSECEPIEEITDDVRKLAERMLDDMYAAGGCGLAAPQIGELVQMVVIDVDYDDEHDPNPYVLINPKIVEHSDELMPFEEGCLSFPGITVPTERPNRVKVHALNLDGVLMEYEAADNLMCICLQHEIDHLHGITMIDHADPSIRLQLLKLYQQALEDGARPGDTGKFRD